MSANPDIRAGRLDARTLQENFGELNPPLTHMQAAVEAARCLYCHDAPCTEACPTGIDIPGFIRKIGSGNTRGAAVTILSENIMGGTCACVCPVEELCEQACVRNAAEDKPVEIGRLQRFATDHLFALESQPFQRQPDTGRQVAVVGAGPAGLSCAHGLARLGHQVTVFEAREKPGGLNEYGLAAYKMLDQRAAKEVAFILGVGGIDLKPLTALGRDVSLDALRQVYDAVFLGLGHNAVNSLGLEGERAEGFNNAVGFIEAVRQEDLASLPVGRRVLVIGGGNTAIDIAVQARKLGAEWVTIVYRRGPEDMGATAHEQEIAQTNGVLIKHWARPVQILQADGALSAIEFEYTTRGPDGQLKGTGETFTLEADQAFKAIGQRLDNAPLDGEDPPKISNGRIWANENRQTSLANVWAGGDCIAGPDLTVHAVQDGKIAAHAIHQYLTESPHG